MYIYTISFKHRTLLKDRIYIFTTITIYGLSFTVSILYWHCQNTFSNSSLDTYLYFFVTLSSWYCLLFAKDALKHNKSVISAAFQKQRKSQGKPFGYVIILRTHSSGNLFSTSLAQPAYSRSHAIFRRLMATGGDQRKFNRCFHSLSNTHNSMRLRCT